MSRLSYHHGRCYILAAELAGDLVVYTGSLERDRAWAAVPGAGRAALTAHAARYTRRAAFLHRRQAQFLFPDLHIQILSIHHD